MADQVRIRENKLSLVERLADDLAHEIKNPLHSMVINLEVLRRRIARLPGDSNEELLRYAGVLNAELERVNRRVDLLLRLIRPNRDFDEPATMVEVIDELQELVELECERHKVNLSIDVTAAPLWAQVPRASTRQMILGLILETLDDVPPGGALSVSAVPGEGEIRVRFEGRMPDGRSALTRVSSSEASYVSAVREIAHRFGGDLLALNTPDEPDADGPAVGFSYVLCLPDNSRSPSAPAEHPDDGMGSQRIP